MLKSFCGQRVSVRKSFKETTEILSISEHSFCSSSSRKHTFWSFISFHENGLSQVVQWRVSTIKVLEVITGEGREMELFAKYYFQRNKDIPVFFRLHLPW